MIKIEVDEAYAYDMLSILEVKTIKSKGGRKAYDNYSFLQEMLRLQVGSLMHTKIVGSEEFNRLFAANKILFERIDEIKTRNPFNFFKRIMDAKFIDDMNYERYLAKKALQEKFFPTQKLSEQKIGYEKRD